MTAASMGVRRLLREVGDRTTATFPPRSHADLPTHLLDALATDDPAVARLHLVELAAGALVWAEQIDDRLAEKASIERGRAA